jgi:hypothetical protein
VLALLAPIFEGSLEGFTRNAVREVPNASPLPILPTHDSFTQIFLAPVIQEHP